ncbi:MAG: hypothetical protein NXH95_02070 [Pseudomonadaceae bacterium]|nr:hypothetical protein [Pseudomonadaceae bacterium]
MRHLNVYTLCFSLWLLAFGPVASAAPVDLRLVVDVSQATHGADRSNARRTALEYFIRALPDDAYAGVWSYAQYVRQVAKLDISDGLWKQVASIHAASLQPEGGQAKLEAALLAATKLPARHDTSQAAHMVLVGSGVLRSGAGETADKQARQRILTQWLPEQRTRNRKIHTIAIGQPEHSDHVLLRQLSEFTGGVHVVAGDATGLRDALVDVLAHVEPQPLVQADEAGRFQVAPGATRLTVTWFGAPELSADPRIELPDGQTYSRNAALTGGRWLLDQSFEMLTIEDPLPGWWTLKGKVPDQLAVFGELGVKIDGIDATVVPTDESKATISLFDGDQLISLPSFLDLLQVRAWVHSGADRSPLPVERVDTQYVAHFVTLDDGFHELEVEIVAPTFKRRFLMPFTVANPMLVDILADENGQATAWFQFSHPEVDYATLKATGMVRKPPQIASLIPGQALPAGVWRIPLDQNDGIVEVSFSAAGNYLDGSGLFIKTKPHAISLPLMAGERLRLRYDAQGKMIEMPAPDLFLAEGLAEETDTAYAEPSTTTQTPASAAEPTAAVPAASELPLIPLWFVALISLLNFVLAAGIWWLNKPKPLELAID